MSEEEPGESALARALSDLRNDGLGVLQNAFTPTLVAAARKTVLDNLRLMENTRPSPASRHLAGFHRYPPLEPLHVLISGNPRILSCISKVCGAKARTIGLSDITVNRSQHWHNDLLRGEFRKYLNEDWVWSAFEGAVCKIIWYLQDSTSLRFVPGSHRRRISLASDGFAAPPDGEEVRRQEVRSVDAVVMDVRTIHRGSGEELFQTEEAKANPRILISTVFGAEHCALTDQMEAGNAARLADWMRRNVRPTMSLVE